MKAKENLKKQTHIDSNHKDKFEHHNKIRVENLSFYYNRDIPIRALKNINLDIPEKRATALIGPSGCGKSTFLKVLNRMSDLIDNCRIEGNVFLDDCSIFSSDTNVVKLRKKVGMVFQRSNPFPKSIFDNIAYGPRLFGEKNKIQLSEIVESTLHSVGLWDEVKTRLYEPAFGLSGGQQQRLCIARALAVNPEVLLMDEPASALDPIGSGKIEELIFKLKKKYTIVIVTHNMQQAARVSDYTAFFYYGELVELNSTEKIFTNPDQKATEDYVTGRFG